MKLDLDKKLHSSFLSVAFIVLEGAIRATRGEKGYCHSHPTVNPESYNNDCTDKVGTWLQ